MSGRARRVAATWALVAAVAGSLPAGPAAGATARVVAGQLRFAPARVEVLPGDTVIWEAADDGHTVTARDGMFDSSSRGVMAEGDEFRWRFRVPGTYAYYCRVHHGRGMQGEVLVVDPYAPTSTSTRLTPVTAAATTSTTAPAVATTTTAPVTTTSRALATSSTTNPRAVASAPAAGAPAEPQEPPTLNPDTPVLGTAEADAQLPGARAAARRAEAENDPVPFIAAGGLAVLLLAGAALVMRARRRHRPSP